MITHIFWIEREVEVAHKLIEKARSLRRRGVWVTCLERELSVGAKIELSVVSIVNIIDYNDDRGQCCAVLKECINRS